MDGGHATQIGRLRRTPSFGYRKRSYFKATKAFSENAQERALVRWETEYQKLFAGIPHWDLSHDQSMRVQECEQPAIDEGESNVKPAAFFRDSVP